MIPLIKAISGLIRLSFDLIFGFFAFLFAIDMQGGQNYNAGFMPYWKRLRLLNTHNTSLCADGVRQLSADKITNSLTIGASGSGKTSVNFIPSILKTDYNFIVTDVDGDIYHKTSGDLKRRGYDIQVVNFADVNKSVLYNPLAFCKTDSDLKKLAKSIISTAYPNAKGSDGFWNSGGESILYIFLRLLHRSNPKYQNLYNLMGLLKRYSMVDHFVSTNSSEDIWNDYLGFSSADQKIVSGQVSSALTALDAMAEDALIHLTSDNTLAFSKLSISKSCLFIIIPEVKLKHYKFLLSILYGQIFEYFQIYKSKRKIQCFMDEFGIQYIPSFPTLINTCRRYNLSLHLACQDIKQIHGNYGSDGASMIINGGCSTKIIYPGMSLELARDLSMSLGRKTYQVKDGKHKRTSHRELLSIQELIQMKNKAILVHKNLPPYLMKMKPYFRQLGLRQKTKVPPVPFPVSNPKKPALIPLSVNNHTRP